MHSFIMLIMKKSILILILLIVCQIASSQSKLQIANQYYLQGDFKKASVYYEGLAQNRGYIKFISKNYLQILKSDGQFKKAETFILKTIKWFPSEWVYKSNLLSLYYEMENKNKAEKYFSTLKNKYKQNPFILSILAKYFRDDKLYKQAIEFYLLSRNIRNNSNLYALELASLYRTIDKKREMILEYLNYSSLGNHALNYVKNIFQNYLEEKNDIDILQSILIDKVQQYPDSFIYVEFLIWLEIQKKNFYGAFLQARALDKRNNVSGNRTLSIAKIALDNKAYDDAIDIYGYVAKNFSNHTNGIIAKKKVMETKELKVKSIHPVNIDNLRKISSEYLNFFEKYSPHYLGYQVLRKKALLHAFYLNEKDSAIYYLNLLIKDGRVQRKLYEESKLDLGDIYLLKEEPWEASLLYSQVEKTSKNENLVNEAKFRNARLQYFMGNFELAKGHLDILKINTTRNIANDALSLEILITDNTLLDSASDEIMKKFSNVQLLNYQNKKQEALDLLDKIIYGNPEHGILDEAYWLKSEISLDLNNYEVAINNLNLILDNYSFDILADDATFKIAEIYHYHLKDIEKAKEMYKKVLTNFPQSQYVYQSRKRYRHFTNDQAN